MKREYKILVDSSAEGLVQTVNQVMATAASYQLLGGPTVYGDEIYQGIMTWREEHVGMNLENL